MSPYKTYHSRNGHSVGGFLSCAEDRHSNSTFLASRLNGAKNCINEYCQLCCVAAAITAQRTNERTSEERNYGHKEGLLWIFGQLPACLSFSTPRETIFKKCVSQYIVNHSRRGSKGGGRFFRSWCVGTTRPKTILTVAYPLLCGVLLSMCHTRLLLNTVHYVYNCGIWLKIVYGTW